MQTRLFGRADGQDVHEVTLASRAGAQAKILSWGAVVRDFTVPDGAAGQKVVLGFDRLENYLLHSPHFGAMAGRFANRIAHGRFRLDNRQYQLETNEAGRHALHGGSRGFGARPWRLEGADAHAVRLRLVSPAGEGGYPGRLDTICTYRLLEPAILRLEIEATADAPTIVNLAHHSYFNLAQHGADVPSVLDHHLAVNAQFYTPVDAELIPTGEIRAVAGTPYDFRTARPLRNPEHLAYDINYVLADIAGDQDGGLALAAALHAPSNELSLSVFTSEPGLQVYDGAKLAVPCAGLDGARYARHAGLCLEPQRFPDSPNRRHFSAARLDPDEIYRQTTEYHVLRRG
jgi:aldose 1-epimerase